MTSDRIIWFGRYEGWLRSVAHGVKDGDNDCIRLAARLFDLMLPDTCTVVPMPGHNGRADRMLDVATCLSSISKDAGRNRALADCLRCRPHESNYDQKQDRRTPAPVKMTARKIGRRRKRGDIYIIDNCIVSGATASAALSAIPSARVCALAASSWR